MKPITVLAPNEVFIFGANSSGFHGAGAAGYAMRGTASNTWRTDEAFLRAMRAPVGHPDRVGKWAVYGVARGLQQGREGKSYGIETIVRPGMKRSVSLDEIGEQLTGLFSFAATHGELTFLMTPVGASLSGWTAAEMKQTWDTAILKYGKVLSNIVVPADLYL
jgi:hypothetical protein